MLTKQEFTTRSSFHKHIEQTDNNTITKAKNIAQLEVVHKILRTTNTENYNPPQSSTNHKDNAKEHESIFEAKASEIIRFIKSDQYIEGEISRTQLYMEQLASSGKIFFGPIYQKTWLRLYQLDNDLLYKFICFSSSLDYEILGEYADTMVLSACSHTNELVNEAAIRAVESWEQVKHVEQLKNMKPFNLGWLEKYRQEVISDLSE